MRALILNNGGSRGQYHIGAVRYMYNVLNLKHQIVCGTSIGAVLGSYLCQYPYGQETFAINRLADVFTPLNTKDFYTDWLPWRYLAGVFNRPSFYNSAPLRNLISTHIDVHKIKDSGKSLRIGATHIQPVHAKTLGIIDPQIARGRISNTTNYVVYDENSPDLLKAIMASSAFAPLLEPVDLAGSLAIDGCIQTITPIKTAIDAGATVIDIVLCHPEYGVFPITKKLTALNVGLHVIDLMLNRLNWIDIARTTNMNRLVRAGQGTNHREVQLNIIHPQLGLDVDSQEYNPREAVRLQRKGWNDARLVLE